MNKQTLNDTNDTRVSNRVRVLTVADIHQMRVLYHGLQAATEQHKPDVVAFVGDVLHAFELDLKIQFTVPECAKFLANLPVAHIVFALGNHDDGNWHEFVSAWPHENRKLIGLYGTVIAIGPLVVVGFPCMTGSEFNWCAHLPSNSDQMELVPTQCREPLPDETDMWLPQLLRKTGHAGRTIWLMHESPVGYPLTHPSIINPVWTSAVERFAPRLVISGHDHETPLENGTWHAKLESTTCINVGQTEEDFHYSVIDFTFPCNSPSLPSTITIKAMPGEQEISIGCLCS